MNRNVHSLIFVLLLIVNTTLVAVSAGRLMSSFLLNRVGIQLLKAMTPAGHDLQPAVYNMSGVMEFLERLEQLGGCTPSLVRLQTRVEIQQSQLEEALNRLDTRPCGVNDQTGFVLLGSAELARGDWQAAVNAWEKGQAVGQLAALGDSFVGNKQWNEALVVYTSLGNTNPTASTFFIIGTIEQELGNLDDARRAFIHSIEIDPNYIPALYQLGQVERAKGYLSQARMWYLRAASADPKEQLYNFWAGEVLAEQGDCVQAEEYYWQSLPMDASGLYVSWAHHALGNCWVQNGQEDRAESEYQAAIRAYTGQIWSRFALGDLYVRRGDRAAARKTYLEILDIDPGSNPVACASLRRMGDELPEACAR